MTGRLPGLLAAFGVTMLAAGITAGSTLLPPPGQNGPAGRTSAPVDQRLPRSEVTTSLVCPGPETLLVPAGGTPLNPGVPVLLRALAESSTGPAAAKLTLLGPSATAIPISAPGRAKELPTPLAASRATTAPPSTPTAASSEQQTSHLSVAGSTPAGRTGSSSSIGSSLGLDSTATGPAVGTLAAGALGPAVLSAAPVRAANGVRSAAMPKPVTLAAVQSTLSRSGALRGLAATACSAAQSDSWLVGGGTVTGERLRLLLANPSATTAAVVDVDIHGPRGRVSAPSADGVLVPPGGEVPLFVDALAPGLARVAIHVTTRSGRVRATLHDTLLRGLSPAGVDDVPVAVPASKRQVIPGISPDPGAASPADPTAAGSSAIRIAVPGSVEAVARVRLLGPAGTVNLPHDGVVDVPAGGVADIPVSGVPAGTYTAVVDSDVPVVSGALVGRGGVVGRLPASEFGWAGSVRPLGATGAAVLPTGARAALSLAATKSAGRLTVTEIAADGSTGTPVRVDLAAGTSQTVSLTTGAAAVQIAGLAGGPISGSILAWSTDPRGTLISVLPLDLVKPPAAPTEAVQDPDLGLH